MPPEKVKDFGKQVPMQRPGQPKELAPVYIMLAVDEASYVSGATVAVTGANNIVHLAPRTIAFSLCGGLGRGSCLGLCRPQLPRQLTAVSILGAPEIRRRDGDLAAERNGRRTNLARDQHRRVQVE